MCIRIVVPVSSERSSTASQTWLTSHRPCPPVASGPGLVCPASGSAIVPSSWISHTSSPGWRPLLRDVELNRQTADPADYADLLAGAGCEVDAWETTYVHILAGTDPVLEWYLGTGLRPVLAALDADQAADFLAEYGAQVREAYPPRPFATVFPFRRLFAIAHRAH